MTSIPDQLAAYERQLKRESAALAAAEADVARLRPQVESLAMVVDGMRGLVRALNGPPERAPLSTLIVKGGGASAAVAGGGEVVVSRKLTYGGRPSIPAVILEVLPSEPTRLSYIHALVEQHPAFAGRKKPSRGSVSNRLLDMANRGEIERVERGVYKSLSPTGDAENPSGRGGPNPAVQPGAEKPPGEQLIPAHPGQPITTLEGASRDRS